MRVGQVYGIFFRDLFHSEEIDKLIKATQQSDHFQNAVFGLKSLEGLKIYQTFWSDPPCNDVLGLATKTVKVAGVCEEVKVHYFQQTITSKSG